MILLSSCSSDAKGATRFIFPDNVGISVEKKRRFAVMETHYDNPTNEDGLVDSSGVRIYYTNTEREHKAGSLLIGDSLVSRAPDEVISGFRYQHTCPSECTNRLNEPVTLISTFLHMHTTGQEIYVNVFSESNEFTRNLNKVNFWSDSFQQNNVLDKPQTLNPGEQFQVTCTYDTSKRPTTKFGLTTLDEMCMAFVMYWPLQVDTISTHELNLCALNVGDEANTTFCGDNGRMSEIPELFTFPGNPKFNDTVGAPTDFGKQGAVCPTPSSTPTQSPSRPATISVTPPSVQSSSVTPSTTIGVAQPSDEIIIGASPEVNESLDPSNEAEIPVTTSASLSPSPTPETEENENACFPSSANVMLKNGKMVTMEDLIMGDEVVVRFENENIVTSPVFMFTHFDSKVRYSFITLRTNSNKTISLSGGHFLYLNNKLEVARKVVVGDQVETIDGVETVISVSASTERGLYNPQTVDGDIVVDGFVTSTFTESIHATTATALLSPLRSIFKVFGIDSSFIFSSW